jgi:uncharacterized membrane protein
VNNNLVSGYHSTAIGGNWIAGRLSSVDHCLLTSTLGQHQTEWMSPLFSRPNKLRDAELACEWAQNTVRRFAYKRSYYHALQSL